MSAELETTVAPELESQVGGVRGNGRAATERKDARVFVGRFGLPLFLVAEIALFSFLLSDSFPTSATLVTILSGQASLGILAMAVTVPLIAGEFDLAVGQVMGVSAIGAIWLVGHGVPLALVVLIVLASGLIIGAINAFFVVVLRVNAFIATLGVATVLAGVAQYITDGQILFENLSSSFQWIGATGPLGIPRPAIYLLGVAIVLWYILEHTPAGRQLAAAGRGRAAAKLAGLPVRRLVGSSFLASGLLSALAGLIEASRLGSAGPTFGPEFLLPAFAAAFLGTTTIKRGQFNVWGSVVAVFFLAIGIVALQQFGAPFWLTPLFNGAALLVAVTVTYVSAKDSVYGRQEDL